MRKERQRRRAAAAAAVLFACEKGSMSMHASAFAPAHRHDIVSTSTRTASTRRSMRLGSSKDSMDAPSGLSNTAVPSTCGRSRLDRKLVARGISTIDDAPTAVVDESSEIAVLEEELDRLSARTQAGTSADRLPHRLSAVAESISEKLGKVDESRLVFPEISTGQVPRLFSNLEYDRSKTDGKVSSAVHAAGSTLGAASLIAGTTVGAGVLALPAATAPAGFVPSSAALGLAWAYMTISGLLISELSLNRIGDTGRPGVGILDLYKSSLGDGPVSLLGSGAYFFLHYAIMVAYLAQGGSNLGSFLDAAGLDAIAGVPGVGQVLFACVVGAPLYFAKSSAIEKTNNALVAGVIATFAGIMAIGAGSADFAALIAPENQHPDQVVNAFPILFLSLVYQNVVPTVVTQLEGDRKKITTAIVAGTAIPLLMFLAWNAVILGNVMGAPGALTGNLDPIALLQNEGHGGPALSALVGVFSELAVTTSLIGFVYGIVDALTDVSGLPTDGPRFEKWKPALFAGALLPPLAISCGNPDIFYQALDYGGAFGVSTLFLILPPIMVWKERYGEEQKPITVSPMFPGGKISLGSLWKAAGTLIVEQGADKLGVFDLFNEKFFS